jgi:hypothetical protein
MTKTTKATQKTNAKYYLEQLQGMDLIKASDITVIIEQAKALKDMCFREALNGNPDLINYFVKIGKLIMECYNNMPEIKDTEEKTNIEQAISVLFSL